MKPAWNLDRVAGGWALSFGVFVYLMQPTGITVMDDDFGYLRSVVRTLQAGRPWTDDWLEPWSASLSVLTALLYRATGSFQFAVHGIQAVLAGTAFGAVMAFLHRRGFGRARAILVAGLLLTFPTLLWKQIQFTGMAIYIPCLLLAIGAAEKRRWGPFLAGWTVALASRQSAIAWGILPAVEVWRLLRSREEDRWEKAAYASAAIVGGVGVFLLMQNTMNTTHSQRLITARVLESVDGVTALQTAGLGGLFFLCAVGLGAFALGGLDGLAGEGKSRLRILIAGVAAVPLLVLDLRTRVQTEHLLLSTSPGWAYASGLALMALAGWTISEVRVRWDFAIASAGSLLLIALRPQVWDYYFIDVGLFGFFSVVRKTADRPGRPHSETLKPSAWQGAGVMLLVGLHLVFILRLKGVVDKSYALCRLHEESVRSQRISPTEIGKSPFGFQAWYLFPWFAAHDGAADRDIAGFTRYLSPGAILIGKVYSPALHILPTFQDRTAPTGSEVLSMVRTRHFWFFDARYFLLHFPDRPRGFPDMALPPDYRIPHFPLNELEWRALIESGQLQPLGS